MHSLLSLSLSLSLFYAHALSFSSDRPPSPYHPTLPHPFSSNISIRSVISVHSYPVLPQSLSLAISFFRSSNIYVFRCFLSSSAFLASFHHGSFVYLRFFVSVSSLLSYASPLLFLSIAIILDSSLSIGWPLLLPSFTSSSISVFPAFSFSSSQFCLLLPNPLSRSNLSSLGQYSLSVFSLLLPSLSINLFYLSLSLFILHKKALSLASCSFHFSLCLPHRSSNLPFPTFILLHLITPHLF